MVLHDGIRVDWLRKWGSNRAEGSANLKRGANGGEILVPPTFSSFCFFKNPRLMDKCLLHRGDNVANSTGYVKPRGNHSFPIHRWESPIPVSQCG